MLYTFQPMEVPPSDKRPAPRSGTWLAIVMILAALIGAIVAKQYRAAHPPSDPTAQRTTTDESW